MSVDPAANLGAATENANSHPYPNALIFQTPIVAGGPPVPHPAPHRKCARPRCYNRVQPGSKRNTCAVCYVRLHQKLKAQEEQRQQQLQSLVTVRCASCPAPVVVLAFYAEQRLPVLCLTCREASYRSTAVTQSSGSASAPPPASPQHFQSNVHMQGILYGQAIIAQAAQFVHPKHMDLLIFGRARPDLEPKEGGTSITPVEHPSMTPPEVPHASPQMTSPASSTVSTFQDPSPRFQAPAHSHEPGGVNILPVPPPNPHPHAPSDAAPRPSTSSSASSSSHTRPGSRTSGSAAPVTAPQVRMCMTYGCGAVLPREHPWTLCSRCLPPTPAPREGVWRSSTFEQGAQGAPYHPAARRASVPVPQMQTWMQPMPQMGYAPLAGPRASGRSVALSHAHREKTKLKIATQPQPQVPPPSSPKGSAFIQTPADLPSMAESSTVPADADTPMLWFSPTADEQDIPDSQSVQNISRSGVRVSETSPQESTFAKSSRTASPSVYPGDHTTPSGPSAAPSTLRACSTPGCTGIVPLDSRWGRCITCGLQRLRIRLHSNSGAEPSVSGAQKEDVTGSSQEHPEVQVLDDTKAFPNELPIAPSAEISMEDSEDIDAMAGMAQANDKVQSVPPAMDEDPVETVCPAQMTTVKAKTIPAVVNPAGTASAPSENGGTLKTFETTTVEANIRSSADEDKDAQTRPAVSKVGEGTGKPSESEEIGPETLDEDPPSPHLPPSSPPALSSSLRATSPTSPASLRTGFPSDTQPTSDPLGWDTDESELTPLEDSTDEGESEVDMPDSDDEPPPPTSSPAKRKPASANPKAEPLILTYKRHVCASAQCHNFLALEDRWKTCWNCREYHREYRKQRLAAAKLGPHKVKKENDQIVPSEQDPPGSRVCSLRYCCRVIPPLEEYPYKWCDLCRTKRRDWKRQARSKVQHVDGDPLSAGGMPAQDDARPRKRKYSAIQTKLDIDPNAPPKKRRHSGNAETASILTTTPYQSLTHMLQALRTRFTGFIVAQTTYLTFKLQHASQSDTDHPMVFSFDGEYSVVADPAGGVVDTTILGVIRKLEATIGMQFRRVGMFSGPDSAVIMRFSGVYDVQVPIHGVQPPSPTEPLPIGIMLKRMSGEVEICVAWDRRHEFIPGQRIVVRFRLIG